MVLQVKFMTGFDMGGLWPPFVMVPVLCRIS